MRGPWGSTRPAWIASGTGSWGPEGFRIEVHELDLRIGGALSYDMIADAREQIEYMKKTGMGTSHATRGTFAEIAPVRSLEINYLIDFIPGLEPYENRVRVDFFRESNRVRMVITVERHRDDEWTKLAARGWESQLTKLPAALAAPGGE